MVKKFKELNIILKILVGIIAVWLWPFTLFLLCIELGVTGLKNKQKIKSCIGIIGVIFFAVALINMDISNESTTNESINKEEVSHNNISKAEPTVENIQSALIENGFDIKEVYIATLDNDRLAIHVYSDIDADSVYKKGLDIINFVESNFNVNTGYWIAGYKEEYFFGSFRIDEEHINPNLTLADLKEMSHSQNGVLDPEY